MKKHNLFLILSWLWLSMVVLASLVPKPKFYVRQIIKKMLQLTRQSDIDKNVHFVFYFLLVFLFILAYTNYKKRVLIFLGAILISGIIEFMQPLVTHGLRKCDIHDFAYNVLGCTLGLIIALSLEYIVLISQKLSQPKFS